MSITLHSISNIQYSQSTRLEKSIFVPGDKSVSHRALLLGALANGKSQVHGLLKSDDVLSTWRCLLNLGVQIEQTESDLITIHGQGLRGLKRPTQALDCGNSGTTLRLLMGILAGQEFTSSLTGDASLSRRPMKRVADPLRQMGAEIQLCENEFAPVTIEGKTPLQPIHYKLPIASAQVKSALLFAGLFTEGKTTLSGKLNSRDHTERLLPHFGIQLEMTESEISISGNQKLDANILRVPGDLSSAAFWIGAALIVPGSEIRIENVSLNPSRTGILDVFRRMGAQIEVEVLESKPEPLGRILVRKSNLAGTTVLPDEIPSLIDEIPLLSVIACFAEGETLIRGAQELRNKETDRIQAVASGLRAMGARVEAFPDGLSIRGPQKLKGAQIDSFHDHRIAMAFSIAALQADGPTEILNPECVSISYPEFYSTLQSLTSKP